MATAQPTPTNAELVRAMQAVASVDNADVRRDLYTAFLQSTLLVPVAPQPGAQKKIGWRPVEGETPVEFIVAQDDEEKFALFAFTDEESMTTWKSQGSSFIAVSAPNLFQMALDMNIESMLINVAGPVVGGELTRWEIQALASGIMPTEQGDEGAAQMTIPPGTRVAFGPLSQPASEPLLATLKNALASHSEIRAAYLFELQVGNGDPQRVAGIDFEGEPDEAVIERVMNALGEAITPVLGEDEFLDFMVLGDEDAPPVTPDPETLIYERH
ncbi:MAG: enhanced serine sensitivity protein SseB C-terminal domain-containing protein [Chloroflexi bacterium]|nr:enhanced serine sensitivity protein SseB C-terminal domain-containing protein [Chloroflexota bacterium]